MKDQAQMATELATGLKDGLAQWAAHLEHCADEPLPVSVAALVRTKAPSHGDKLLVHLFEDGEAISYKQLDELSDALANGLAAKGLRPGDRMAVMLSNCIQYHLTWIALAKLGAIIVPVNPSYTSRELVHVLKDSQATCWLVHSDSLVQARAVLAELPQFHPHMLIDLSGGLVGTSVWHTLLDLGEGETASYPEPTLGTVLSIQYTSGTTGFPKGCVLTHGYWLNLARSAMSLHVQEHQRFFTAQPFFYMDPFWQFLQTLWSGGTLFAAKKLSASRFFGWLSEYRIEWAQMPELALKFMGEVHPQDLALRQVFTFGWGADSRVAFTREFGVVANESFGMTEIGLGLAMPVQWPASDRGTSVGVAALRREAKLMVAVDGDWREAQPGETGELWLRGEHLFQGYWNQPEATEAVFHDEWFRTGDAFVRDAMGFFRIVGRFKDMIRRSNENIAAREVESVVRMLPQVLDCAAVAVPDPVRGEEVKVWVQWQSGFTPTDKDVQALITHCQTNLAPFKVPRFIAHTLEFPRTSSNKIAKHQLPRIGAQGSYDRIAKQWIS